MNVQSQMDEDVHHPPQPPSSPIDGFGTPEHPLSPPTSGNRTRSQSSSHATLALVSTAAMRNYSSRSPSAPAHRSLLEEDEVDELDDDPLLCLDSAVCERLEAESFAASQHPLTAPMTGTSKSPRKRSFDTRCADDTRKVSPDSPSPCKLPRTQQPTNVVPFFEQAWVKSVMEKGKALDPPLAESTSGIMKPTVKAPIATQAGNGNKAIPVPADLETAAASSTNRVRSAPASSTSDSDTDLPLAASLKAPASLVHPDLPKPLRAAIAKVEESVKELSEVCSRELDSMKCQLVGKDLVIDQLRAKLRTRPSKRGPSVA